MPYAARTFVLADALFYALCLNARLMMHRSDAEILALKGLAFLARDPDQLLRLLTLTGLELSDLRSRAGDPELLAAVLDFLLAEETLLLPFAAEENLDLKDVHAARRALPGAGEQSG